MEVCYDVINNYEVKPVSALHRSENRILSALSGYPHSHFVSSPLEHSCSLPSVNHQLQFCGNNFHASRCRFTTQTDKELLVPIFKKLYKLNYIQFLCPTSFAQHCLQNFSMLLQITVILFTFTNVRCAILRIHHAAFSLFLMNI